MANKAEEWNTVSHFCKAGEQIGGRNRNIYRVHPTWAVFEISQYSGIRWNG